MLVNIRGKLTPKIIDFGLSINYSTSKTLDHGDHGLRGSFNYIAPEIYSSNCYSATKADIFSLGVILFNLYKGLAPFNQSTDRYYRMFMNKRKKFWRLHAVTDSGL